MRRLWDACGGAQHSLSGGVGCPAVYLEVWGGEETAVRPQNRPNSSGTPVSVRMRLEIFVSLGIVSLWDQMTVILVG